MAAVLRKFLGLKSRKHLVPVVIIENSLMPAHLETVINGQTTVVCGDQWAHLAFRHDKSGEITL